ncbi:hypothetical protein AB0H42_35260, partial [Nocardia sp. NPDC050799]|uniref:hypothetical protein n=1 Tax=Nocardia sp. NPDC050799 TaxID=3154842 RepID=UPI0033EFD91F
MHAPAFVSILATGVVGSALLFQAAPASAGVIVNSCGSPFFSGCSQPVIEGCEVLAAESSE